MQLTMILKRQLFCALPALLLTILCQQTFAQMLTSDDNTISNLYENLLQREYAGPEILPSHQVERKAQRSPSLRLRFGRSMDPPMGHGGDVDQKPIRSPSLRLRWGRSVPYEAAEASDAEENVQRQRSDQYLNYLMNAQKLRNILMAMHQYDVDNAAALPNEDASDEFEREVRKPGPLRLRWGRSTDGRSSAGMAEKEALQKAAETQTENVKE